MIDKKMVFKPEAEWVMFKDECIVPAIVSEELWEKANAVLAVRSLDVKQSRTSAAGQSDDSKAYDGITQDRGGCPPRFCDARGSDQP